MTTTRKKRGRPVKPDGEARTISLPPLRVSPAEHSAITANAAKAGMPVSAYRRKIEVEGKIHVRETQGEDALLFELNRCGVNLHQIVRSLNFGQGVPSDISEVLAELKTAIARVSAAYDA